MAGFVVGEHEVARLAGTKIRTVRVAAYLTTRTIFAFIYIGTQGRISFADLEALFAGTFVADRLVNADLFARGRCGSALVYF